MLNVLSITYYVSTVFVEILLLMSKLNGINSLRLVGIEENQLIGIVLGSVLLITLIQTYLFVI